MQRVLILASLALLTSCAAVNPNPNIGMQSADMAFSQGDCEAAKKFSEAAAQRGEPWAEFRMGALLIDKKCANLSANDVPKAIGWLSKAACYESKSLWERGNELVAGPSGYFNARASSTKAAVMLSDLFVRLRRPGMSWFYLERARGQYTSDEAIYNELTQRLTNIESMIGVELLSAIKEEKRDLCIMGRLSDPPVSQSIPTP